MIKMTISQKLVTDLTTAEYPFQPNTEYPFLPMYLTFENQEEAEAFVDNLLNEYRKIIGSDIASVSCNKWYYFEHEACWSAGRSATVYQNNGHKWCINFNTKKSK